MDTSFQKTKASDEWFTPKELVEALGEFDLDPCEPVRLLWRLAKRGFNKYDDGLSQSWGGQNVRVWLNPPYSQPLLDQFVKKMVEHGNGIMLTFARVDNRLFQGTILPNCDGILFLRHRVRFYMQDGTRGGSPGSGSCLIAFGKENVDALRNSGLEGFLMEKDGPWHNI